MAVAATSDPFSLLGIEPAFQLDEAALELRHRELAARLHPDRYQGETPRARRQALSAAIEVNAAFRRLRDPLSRAEALLARRGWAVPEGAEPRPDPALLLEVMEQREALAEARRARDRAALTALAATMRAREATLVERLGSALGAPEGDGHAERARRTLGELRYARRFLEEVRALEDELD